MRILHTSDWHLGHRLHENAQMEEQELFLNFLEETINNNKIDILLVSGDIFDTRIPSTSSLTLYYNFLIKLHNSGCKYIVITAGNHDSPGNINAPKEILEALSIKVVGKVSDRIEDEVFKLSVNGEELIVAAVPYLRDRDIRKAVEGEDFDEITEKYKKALVEHYNKVAEYCRQINHNDAPVIAMGHLFAIGGAISDSEQHIYVGNLGHIGAKDFSAYFDYVALGHLHRPQIVGGVNHIRYSGSPNILSFSEQNYAKMLIQITIENKSLEIEEIPIPEFRKIVSISGDFNRCVEEIKTITSNEYNLTPWVEVILDNNDGSINGFSDIQRATEDSEAAILKVVLKEMQENQNREQLLTRTRELKELKPLDIFKMKCEEQHFNLDENKEILDAFNEVLSILNEED